MLEAKIFDCLNIHLDIRLTRLRKKMRRIKKFMNMLICDSVERS